MKILFLIIFLILPVKLFANGQVTEIVDPQNIFADIYDATQFTVGSKVIIVSRYANKAVAFGIVKMVNLNVHPNTALIVLEEIIDTNMIMLTDLIYPLDYKTLQDQKVPGFSALGLRGEGHIPAKFKELATYGVFTSEGHSLGKNEFLVSPFQLQYGVTDTFGLKMVSALWTDGYLNAGIKYQALNTKYAKITVSTFGAYKVQSKDYILQTGGVLTFPQNAKFQTHYIANITLDPQFKEAYASKGLGLFTDSSIKSITEYMTDNWNRFLFGPIYNVELQTLGGTASYMWIWTTFHMSLGLGTKDFRSLSFGTNGYYYVYDFFWRF